MMCGWDGDYALAHHPVYLVRYALGHGAWGIAQLAYGLAGVELGVAHEIVDREARHALRLVGDFFHQVEGVAHEFAEPGGEYALYGREAGAFGENVEGLLHADHVAAQDVALAGAGNLAGADDGVGHIAVVRAVEAALDACGHFALGVFADDAGDVAEV